MLLVANAYLVLANDNALVLEMVRAHRRSYRRDLTTVARMEHGFACASKVRVSALRWGREVYRRPDVAIRRTSS